MRRSRGARPAGSRAASSRSCSARSPLCLIFMLHCSAKRYAPQALGVSNTLVRRGVMTADRFAEWFRCEWPVKPDDHPHEGCQIETVA